MSAQVLRVVKIANVNIMPGDMFKLVTGYLTGTLSKSAFGLAVQRRLWKWISARKKNQSPAPNSDFLFFVRVPAAWRNARTVATFRNVGCVLSRIFEPIKSSTFGLFFLLKTPSTWTVVGMPWNFGLLRLNKHPPAKNLGVLG